MENIAPALLEWFYKNQRILPFRTDPSPYHVWLSEIMLQQTRVSAALPYYERFVAELPDPAALAACDPDKLRKLWQGLGYYSRVANMQKAAQIVCRQYGGAQNIALDLQRLQMSFSLPARNGRGEPLTQEALQVLLRQRQPAVFFSRDLCARYFTDSDNGESRFVLYDDAGTLRQKLNLGRQLGVAAAFLQWPEIRDIAAELLRFLIEMNTDINDGLPLAQILFSYAFALAGTYDKNIRLLCNGRNIFRFGMADCDRCVFMQ